MVAVQGSALKLSKLLILLCEYKLGNYKVQCKNIFYQCFINKFLIVKKNKTTNLNKINLFT